MKIYKPKLFNQLPDAFLFDLDNTLYPYEPSHNAAQKFIRNKIINKFSITKNDFDKAFSNATQQVKSINKKTAASHSRLLYFQRMLEIMGLGSQILIALELEQSYWRTFLNKAVLFENVKELLDDIRLLGIPSAIVTNLTAQIQFRKLIFFGLENYFDYIITSEEAGADKPHHKPFKIAIEKIKPKGKKIWMIGDSPSNDIQPSRESINAVTLQKIHTGVKVGIGDYKPDAYFKNFSTLKKLVAKLNKN